MMRKTLNRLRSSLFVIGAMRLPESKRIAAVPLCYTGRGAPRVRRSPDHGFALFRRSPESGFTLVELMVVIAVIGLLSTAVMFALPDPRGRLVEDADRFAARVAALRDAAVVTSQPMGLWVSPSGYGFERRLAGRWETIDEKPFRTTDWKERTVARAAVQSTSDAREDGPQASDRIVLHFDSTGLPSDAARVVLHREAEQLAVRIDADGRVKVGD
ncbi:GspH/FimT family pseudopilin [Sphingobium subterraneum]|uniref:Type II secretion system protein H n=1 Tax=Sphingobium subterraneum TaxID=627688 RepID=A0A841IX31_9SPHN|nr:GspH/FimT family pseudopilin [Sphingobium subterraneum]MBB6122702.1 general secretion pathway protein H [Sphingobium subterraneum]